jgi:hypothetical protein
MDVSSVSSAGLAIEVQAKEQTQQQKSPPPPESDSVDLSNEAKVRAASSVLDE